MNVKDYIESGVLELYVAGALPKEEMLEVEVYANQHAELREEIKAIEIALENYAQAYAKKPSHHVIDKVLMEIEQPRNVAKQGSKILEMKPHASKSASILKYLAYAASVLLFLSGALNVYYYNKYHQTQQQLIALQGEKDRLAGLYDAMQANYNNIASEMNILKNPDNIAVVLKGLAIKPDALATVYWNKNTGHVHLNINNLPVPPNGKQYQLWALKDGKPIDAGVFNLTTNLYAMKTILSADAFAISLEPAGGSISPTMDLIYVIGNV